jgi:hypothetical protein
MEYVLYDNGDKINAIVFDDEDNIYIGETASSVNIATPISFDNTNLNNETGFAKLDQNGGRLWGSYLGSSTKVYSLVFENNHYILVAMEV